MTRAMICLTLIAAASTSVFADAAELVRASGIQGGLVVHLGCGDGSETVKLRLSERHLVQGLDTDAGKVQAARKAIRAAGLYGPVSAYRYDGKTLPYVDNLVNVIVASGATTVPQAEILRVLVPRGVALLGDQRIVKPWPATIDEWTHFLHGPDNNAVGKDRLAAQPRSIQWVSGPRWGRSHEELASMSAAVSANGRVFFIVDEAPLASIRFLGRWMLVARDAFNGTLLWKRPIPGWSDHLRHFRAGPVHLPRRLVAVGEKVYATLGLDAPVTGLDAATGRTLTVYQGTERTEEILAADGVLYLVVGTSEAHRKGGGLHARGEPRPTDFRYITAIEAAAGKALWKVACPQGEFLLPLSLAVRGGSVFYQSTGGVVRLDARSGKQLWKTPRKTPLRRMSFSAPTVVAAGEVLLVADRVAPGSAGAKPEDGPAEGRVEWGVHGWGEPGFPRKTKVVLVAYAVETGSQLWRADCSEGYNSPVDVFVVGDSVWVGSDYKGYELKTGKLKPALKWRGAAVGMPHHRCYRNKATERFLFTGRSGIEVVSLEKGWIGNNSWIRGTCQYGIMPANGLLYAPPDACACYAKVKLAGFFAAAPQRGKDGHMPFPERPVLEKGPAYGAIPQPAIRGSSELAGGDPQPDAWPMYRHDGARSGATSTRVGTSVNRKWSVPIGGRLTQPVVAGGKVVVASTDAHTVHALSAGAGKQLWTYTAGGRIDSSPTLYKGLVLFGSADGWVHALRASDGELAWRFRAAPQERLTGAFDQLESVWPVHGAVLVQNDTLYCVAGRCTYIDGGLVLYRIDPLTGKELSRTVVCDLDPKTGRQLGPEKRFDMEGATTDILSGDGDLVFLKHLSFDRSGKRTTRTKPHLFAATGLLGEEWFVRSYWLLGTDVGTGWSKWANTARQVPAGRILSFTKDHVYGYGRVTVSSGATGHKADAYHLFCRSGTAPRASALKEASGKAPAKDEGTAKGRRKGKPRRPRGPAMSPPVWAKTGSLIVRAMVLASDRLVIAGPPDLAQKDPKILGFRNDSEAFAAFRGERGVLLRVVSAADGKRLSEQKLTAMPVFDGLSAAEGKLFVSLRNGDVQCWGQE